MIKPAPNRVVARQFRQAANSFDEHRAVFDVAAERLEQRLALLTLDPERVLVLGARTGHRYAALQERYPKAVIVCVDPAATTIAGGKNWFGRKASVSSVTADPHNLPFADDSFDLVISNLLLPWCRHPPAVFSEVHRVLNTNGAFFFSSAGPDTLQEYRKLWAQIDGYLHVFGLVDMHELGDALLQSGFAAPVLDRENLQIDYPSIDALTDELRGLGAANIAQGRRFGLMSSQVQEHLRQLAEQGRFTVTLELVQGHGWKDELVKPRNNSNDEYSISLDSLRRSLRSGQ